MTAEVLSTGTFIWHELLQTEFTGWHQELTLSAVVTYGLPTSALSFVAFFARFQ
jgi:hypothetical protein